MPLEPQQRAPLSRHMNTSLIGGKLAREVKAAHMDNLQAVLYLAKGGATTTHKPRGLTLPLVS